MSGFRQNVEIPLEDGLQALRDYAEAYGEPPTFNRWRERRLAPSTEWYRARFGGWRAALVAAGFPGPGQGQYNRARFRKPRETSPAGVDVGNDPA